MDHPSPLEPACTVPAPERIAEACRDWQAHVDAGRIGARTIVPLDAARNLAAWDSLFRLRGAAR